MFRLITVPLEKDQYLRDGLLRIRKPFLLICILVHHWKSVSDQYGHLFRIPIVLLKILLKILLSYFHKPTYIEHFNGFLYGSRRISVLYSVQSSSHWSEKKAE